MYMFMEHGVIFYTCIYCVAFTSSSLYLSSISFIHLFIFGSKVDHDQLIMKNLFMSTTEAPRYKNSNTAKTQFQSLL